MGRNHRCRGSLGNIGSRRGRLRRHRGPWMRKQSAYRPVFEDWLFHVVLPFAAYAVLAVSAFAAPYSARPALFLVGAAALVLLSTGIHNAWDAVTYQIFVRSRKDA